VVGGQVLVEDLVGLFGSGDRQGAESISPIWASIDAWSQ